MWQGGAVLPTDHYLVLDRNGRQSSARWWAPPEPVVPMAEGALALREALSAAVAARVRARNLITCDLGGVDSTSVCCLAARGAAKVVAYTAASPDPLADDVAWIRAASGRAERRVGRAGGVIAGVPPSPSRPPGRRSARASGLAR